MCHAHAAEANTAVNANEEGYNACYDGIPRTANPNGNDNWDDWLKGWDSADREMKNDFANAQLPSGYYDNY